ncbi:hypothetical protein GF389_02040 [Candidatus Dojkabacteria bacterium]|nr:hypothetical protein [Candidatus Dojkabacteria bacterium]
MILQIFPNGISYADGKCQTNGLSELFEFLKEIEEEKLEKEDLVTLLGQKSNQIVELLRKISPLLSFNPHLY